MWESSFQLEDGRAIPCTFASGLEPLVVPCVEALPFCVESISLAKHYYSTELATCYFLLAIPCNTMSISIIFVLILLLDLFAAVTLADYEVALPIEVVATCSGIRFSQLGSEELAFSAKALGGSYNNLHERMDNGSGRIVDLRWVGMSSTTYLRLSTSAVYRGTWVRFAPLILFEVFCLFEDNDSLGSFCFIIHSVVLPAAETMTQWDSFKAP
jgi:hypothetical protein